MSGRKGHAQEPFSLEEVDGIIEIYETLHGKPEGRRRVRAWAGDEKFTEEAFERVIEYTKPQRAQPKGG